MTSSIKLARFDAAPGEVCDGTRHLWPIGIRAVGTNITSDVFVYRVASEGDPFTGDAFSCVASAPQLQELPANRALTSSQVFQTPFYRTSQLTLWCRSSVEAERVWHLVQEDVQRLLDNANIRINDQPDQLVTLSAVASVAPDKELTSSDVSPTVVSNRVEIQIGSKVVVQSTPPNAGLYQYTWLQTDPVTGTVLRAFAFTRAIDGGDDKWHSRTRVKIGDVVSETVITLSPGV